MPHVDPCERSDFLWTHLEIVRPKSHTGDPVTCGSIWGLSGRKAIRGEAALVENPINPYPGAFR